MVERSIAVDIDRKVLMSLKKKEKNHFLFINRPISQWAELEVLNSGVSLFQQWQYDTLEGCLQFYHEECAKSNISGTKMGKKFYNSVAMALPLL